MKDNILKSYTVIDIETPNSNNDSICSIALISVVDDIVASKDYYLVNPEDSFSYFNINLHGITNSMVKDQPTFKEIWSKIERNFTNGIIVAHNATFDLSVISKTLRKYDIEVPDFYYVCTMKLAQTAFLDFEKYKLEYLCSKMDIDLGQHHNAMCDTEACQKLLNKINERIPITQKMIETYHLREDYSKKIPKSEIAKSLNNLYGMVHGISCDRKINEKEIETIWAWIDMNHPFECVESFDVIIMQLRDILEDNHISEEEKSALLNKLREYIPEDAFSNTTSSLQMLMGILDGIKCDQEINISELVSLKEWLNNNLHLRGNFPYDAIIATLEKVMEDGLISSDEGNELLKQFGDFVNPIEAKKDERIQLMDKSVCLTGNFTMGTKDDIGNIIIKHNGLIVDAVSKKTDILVVGGEGSKDWSFGNYGSKVKKAMELREKGLNILIIGELDFLEMI